MLWDLIQKHIDDAPYPPSGRQLAARLGVAPNTFNKWRDLKQLPSKENLQAIADLVGVRYSVVLDAALHDTGYHEDGAVVTLRPRSTTTVEGELRVARANLDEWMELEHRGKDAQRHERELRDRVTALEAELSASRQVTGQSGSVAKL